MNILLWVVQGLLAGVFGMTGWMKVSQKKEATLERMGAQMGWMEDFSQGQIRTIGGLELAGALGLILPPLTGILPTLTPFAALGLMLTMLGAMLTHLRRKEYQLLVINLVLFALAAFVFYGRLVLLPF